MILIFGNRFRIKFERIYNFNRICAMCTQKQFGIIERIKIIDWLSCSELNAFDFLQIDKKYLLFLRRLSAETETVKRFLDGVSQLSVEQ